MRRLKSDWIRLHSLARTELIQLPHTALHVWPHPGAEDLWVTSHRTAEPQELHLWRAVHDHLLVPTQADVLDPKAKMAFFQRAKWLIATNSAPILFDFRLESHEIRLNWKLVCSVY